MCKTTPPFPPPKTNEFVAPFFQNHTDKNPYFPGRGLHLGWETDLYEAKTPLSRVEPLTAKAPELATNCLAACSWLAASGANPLPSTLGSI